MQTTTFETAHTGTKTQKTGQEHTCIFIVQLVDGRYVIGSAKNASRRIAALNSGMNPAVRKSHQIYRIVGIKDITAERTLPIVVNKFCAKYGSERIVVI